MLNRSPWQTFPSALAMSRFTVTSSPFGLSQGSVTAMGGNISM
ncbi:hypothetical protein [Saccharothrix australiensis]|nr:hypothetical protein [Saccharothrix australiensis]